MHDCILDPGHGCTECGQCDYCDLDPAKICDNCCRCLGDAEYRGIEVTQIIDLEEGDSKKRKSLPKD